MADREAGAGGGQVVRHPDDRGHHHVRRVVGVEQPQAGDVLAEQLRGADHDGVEHLVERLPAVDRALDPGQPLEQRLPLLQRGEQRGLVLRVRVAPGPDPALVVDQPAGLQGQAEHVRHADQQRLLVVVERPLPSPADHQARAGQPVAGHVRQGHRPDAVQHDGGAVALQRVDERRVDRQAPREHGRAVQDQRGEVGLEDEGDVLERPLERGAVLGQVGQGGDQLGELHGGAVRVRHPVVPSS
jgi:hypothetical protein